MKRWQKLRLRWESTCRVTQTERSWISTKSLAGHCRAMQRSVQAASKARGADRLQAPFMATFKVRKERIEINSDPNALVETSAEADAIRMEYDTWVQAIFKVGDDCRQDVLALQVIAMFKN